MTVQNFLDFAGIDYVQSPAFEIYNTSGSNTTATVAVSDTALTLVGSGTGTDAFTLANASYDTMTELVDGITALSEGWQVNLLSGGSVSSTLLIPRAATSAFGQANTLRLYYANTALVESLINAASQAIEKYLDTIVVAQTGIREWVDGRGDEDLRLSNIPVTALKRIAYGTTQAFYVQATTTTDLRATVEVQDSQMVLSRVASDGTETASSLTFASNATASALVTAINLLTGWSATLTENCMSLDLHRRAGADALGVNVSVEFPDTSASVRFVEESTGLVGLVGGYDGFGDSMPHHHFGKRNYLAEYAAGYSTVPSDIQQACLIAVQQFMSARGRDDALQSENIGSYSYVKNILSLEQQLPLSATAKSLLAPYRRLSA